MPDRDVFGSDGRNDLPVIEAVRREAPKDVNTLTRSDRLASGRMLSDSDDPEADGPETFYL